MSSSSSVPSNSLRLRGLDALRGFSCLAIVLYHATDRHAVPANLWQYPVRAVHFAISQAYISVFLFFVISGFCIHLQWARTRSRGEAPKIPFGAFWKRRFRRLYPPYAMAIALYVLLTAVTIGLPITRFVVYDIGMHLLMLHNLDSHTAYSISGIFWTLAIEEQLYLAYFLLLFIRVRWGWTMTLTICLLSRAGWMIFSHVVWAQTGFGLPVPEAAASHWFTWALGALAVEAVYGVVKLPRWTQDLRIATVVITAASIISAYLPSISKDTPMHDVCWYLIHPLWGTGFFIVVNRIVNAELGWMRQLKLPLSVSVFATFGLFSYSIYLTHELMIMQSWRWSNPAYLQVGNVFFVVLPATILFAFTFFWFCEKPFMMRRGRSAPQPALVDATGLFPKLAKEGFPSRAFLTSIRARFYNRLRRSADAAESGAEAATAAVGPAARLANTYSDSIAVADGQN